MSKVFEIAFKLGGELTSSFKNAFSSADGMMKTLGAAAVALGGTAALGSLASQVMDMNDSFTQLSAQTGIVGQDLEGLKDVAENLFRNNYGEDFNEINAALANVKQNMHELNDVDLEKFTGDALMFTKTFDEDINDVTRAANNMMSSFGVESSKAMDLFSAGAQRGLNFSDEMLDNVSEYAPLFGAMGYSAEEYFGIMERGAQAGVYNLDYVNDVMKEFQIRVKDGSKATGEAMGGLSKDTQKVWKEFLKGNGTVSEVANTVVGELKGMTDQVEANQIAVSLFGTKWEDLEADAMYAMLGTNEAMKGFEGTMDEINKIQFSSFNSAIQGIGRMLFMDLVYPIGEQALPYLNQFANYLSTNLPVAIEKGKVAIQQYGPAILGAVGAFVAMKSIMLVTKNAQLAFNATKALGTTLLTAYRTAMLASTFAGGGLRGVLAGLRSGMAALNITMLANPFVLVSAAVIALGAAFVLLYQKSETFRETAQPVIDAFKVGLSELGAVGMSVLLTIMDAFGQLGGVVSSVATAILPGLMSTVQMIFPIIVAIIQMSVPLISSIISSLATILTGVVIPAISSLIQIIQFVFPYAQMIIQNALTLITGILTAAMALLRGDWDAAWQAILTTAQTIMNNIISFFSGINLFEVGKAIINGLIDGIASMGGAVITAIGGMIPEPIKGAASKLLGAIPGFATGGVVSNPTLAWVGEGGDTESIIPWNNSQRSKDLWLQAGQQIGMLNDSGALENMQYQIDMKKQANDQPAILPGQVAQSAPNQSQPTIIVQYGPQYNVQNPDDLEQVKQHADKDKYDLEARLAELARDERRKSFGD